MAGAAANRRAVLQMLAAMALFTVNDTLVKLAGDAYSPSQIMVVRGGFACLLLLSAMAAMGEMGRIRFSLTPLVFVRGLLEAAVTFTFVIAVARMPLALLTAVLQATPILIAVLAVMLRIEWMGARRWTAVLMGFCGVIVIVRPSTTGIDLHTGIAILCAVLIAVRDLLTRFIPESASGYTVALVSTAAVTIVGAGLGMVDGGWRPFAWRETIYLFLAAAVVTAGNVAIVQAFRGSDLGVVSPFRYSSVIWASLAGLLVFHEGLDVLTILGTIIVAAAGIYTIQREQGRSRTAPASHAGPLP